MKTSWGLLLKMQLYQFGGINRLLHTGDKQARRRGVALAGLALGAMGVLMAYSTMVSAALAQLGAVRVLPALAALVSGLAVLLLTLLKGAAVLLSPEEQDRLLCLPVQSWEIVLSRLAGAYLPNLLLSGVAALPAAMIYLQSEAVPKMGGVLFLLAIPLLPVIPMAAAMGVSIWIAVLSARTRRKNMFALGASTLAVLLVVAASAGAQRLEPDALLDKGLALSALAARLYPPAALVAAAAGGPSLSCFGAFVGGSVLAGGVLAGVVVRFYPALNAAARRRGTDGGRQMPLRASAPGWAMYKRELARYFSCTIYALNSTIGMVLLTAAAALLWFGGSAVLAQQSGLPGLEQRLGAVLPLAIAVCITMSCTTSASLSLEGKSRWLLCAAPVRAIQVFRAKMAVNLTVVAPFGLLSAVLLGIRFGATAGQAVWLGVVPAAYAVFTALLGMYMNVKFPRYDWPSEYYAVKGGAVSVLATTGLGMLSSTAPLLLGLACPEHSGFIMAGASAAVLAASAALYKKLERCTLYML